jgi:hypothetical protein
MKFRILVLGALILAACAQTPASTPAQTSTPSETLGPTETLEPSATATKTPSPTPNWTATAIVKATDEMDFVLDMVAPDLEMLGFPLDEGELAYRMEEPSELEASGQGEDDFDAQYLEGLHSPVFKDFVLAVDIGWKSDMGLAGCSIIFRSDVDLRGGEFAEFSTARISGAPSYILFVASSTSSGGLVSRGTDPAIDQDFGAINHYVLTAVGSEVTVYVNGERLTRGYIKDSMFEGEIAFNVWQGSGETTCTFSNAWVWEMP